MGIFLSLGLKLCQVAVYITTLVVFLIFKVFVKEQGLQTKFKDFYLKSLKSYKAFIKEKVILDQTHQNQKNFQSHQYYVWSFLFNVFTIF